eukprot:TRINITY_DN83835_c0_g1_i1.p2 TRINITY_DN83835_c0_g1~~TRINITY_DN83835_c0_g1_i1.p2  ORF type:complete len:191 (-),score=0.71 TRINITY_DN83835_c0_g1_i1:43-615(-)
METVLNEQKQQISQSLNVVVIMQYQIFGIYKKEYLLTSHVCNFQLYFHVIFILVPCMVSNQKYTCNLLLNFMIIFIVFVFQTWFGNRMKQQKHLIHVNNILLWIKNLILPKKRKNKKSPTDSTSQILIINQQFLNVVQFYVIDQNIILNVENNKCKDRKLEKLREKELKNKKKDKIKTPSSSKIHKGGQQ